MVITPMCALLEFFCPNEVSLNAFIVKYAKTTRMTKKTKTMANMPNKAFVFLEDVTKTPFFDQTNLIIPLYSLKNNDVRKQTFRKTDKRSQVLKRLNRSLETSDKLDYRSMYEEKNSYPLSADFRI